MQRPCAHMLLSRTHENYQGLFYCHFKTNHFIDSTKSGSGKGKSTVLRLWQDYNVLRAVVTTAGVVIGFLGLNDNALLQMFLALSLLAFVHCT
uniref:Uncharacterized protein n=1 Tax=Hymenochirus boettgeri TaxID=247094 RepID=A0A8T2IAT7_9PIPI|nr:hypothetical protein GDO86_018358 [Hymenochirus boettgeri]